MDFKYLCSDLDGTLLSTKNDVSEFTIEQFQRLKEQLKIILVSARMPKSMTYVQERLGISENPLVSYNGALVLSGEKKVNNIMIPVEVLRELYEIAWGFDVTLGLYSYNEWCVQETSLRVEKETFNTKAEPFFENTMDTLARWESQNQGAHKVMLMGTKAQLDAMEKPLNEQLGEALIVYRSSDTFSELAPSGTSKLLGIASLLEAWHSFRDVLAFGDNYNDLDMLAEAGYGVAVGNAKPEVKEAANALTCFGQHIKVIVVVP
ncbi:MAG: Cof-type HAD-IIB family hydrolase, partial [Bacteroidota bacterium]